MPTHLAVGEIQRRLHVVPHGVLPFVREGHHPIKEGKIAALPHVFHNGRNQPQRVVGASVLDAVQHPLLVRLGDDRGCLGADVLALLQHRRVEQVQSVSLPHLAVQQLQNPLFAHDRLRVGDAHGVLGGVPVSQARAPAHLDEGGEPGEQHVHLALVEVPDVQGSIHILVGGLNLQPTQLFIPEGLQLREGPVRPRLVVPGAGLLRRVAPAGAQIEQHPRLRAGGQGHSLHQGAHRVASQLRAAAQLPLLQPQRVPLRAVRADEGLPHPVEAVRGKVAGEELVSAGLVVQLAQHRVLFVMGSSGVQAHLEVLVVHVDFMEGELHVSTDVDAPLPVGGVPNPDVENLHRVDAGVRLPGDEQGLLCIDPLVFAPEGGIAQPVPRLVFRFVQRQPRRLPAQGPVFAALRVPQVHIVPRPVHGHAIGPETGNPMMLGAVQPGVSAGLMGNHRAHPLRPQIIGHGLGRVHPIQHIFPSLVVKISVAHVPPSLPLFSCFAVSYQKAEIAFPYFTCKPAG